LPRDKTLWIASHRDSLIIIVNIITLSRGEVSPRKIESEEKKSLALTPAVPYTHTRESIRTWDAMPNPYYYCFFNKVMKRGIRALHHWQAHSPLLTQNLYHYPAFLHTIPRKR